jgi:L-alanine-DL-glutamate epimerase-like enolase superfamily enzyme
VSTIAAIEVLAVAPAVPTFRYTDHEPEVITTTTAIRIEDAEGVEGWGAYDSDTFAGPDRAPLERARDAVPRLLGRDADDRDAIESLLTWERTSPFPPAVLSAFDIALWDLAARRDGVALHTMLGAGSPEPVSAYASVPLLEDADAYLAMLEGLTAQGFTAAKIHAWGDPVRDAALLRTIRQAFGSLVLMHDAEGRYDRDGAEVLTAAGAEVGLRWLEAPLPDLDLDGYRSLRGRGVPIFPAGDAVWDERLLREIMRDQPWDAVRFDVSFCGGITAAMRLGEVAVDLDLPIEPIGYGHTLIQAANLHVTLALGRTSWIELPVPPEPWEHGVRTTIRQDADGLVRAPGGAGLGIEVDDRAMRDAAATRIG